MGFATFIFSHCLSRFGDNLSLNVSSDFDHLFKSACGLMAPVISVGRKPMSPVHLTLLLLLSAIWGASFLFMRVASPEFGPVTLILLRMGLAVIAISPLFLNRDRLIRLWQNKKGLTVLGLLNHVIPFCLLAFATLSLEAGFTSLINATTPLFAAMVGAAWFATPIGKRQLIGLVIAFIGIFVLSADRLVFTLGGTGWAIVAGLTATFCYGISINFSKTRLSHLHANDITLGSMTASSLILLIPGLWLWPETAPSVTAWVNVTLLAVVSTALAFLLFFRLLVHVGAVASSTVTFLVPIFAVGWGVFLLDEVITARLFIGMIITLTGTALALGLIPNFKRPKSSSV